MCQRVIGNIEGHSGQLLYQELPKHCLLYLQRERITCTLNSSTGQELFRAVFSLVLLSACTAAQQASPPPMVDGRYQKRPQKRYASGAFSCSTRSLQDMS